MARQPWEQIAQRAAERFGVPFEVVRGVIMAESGGRADAKSPVGAQGMMQLMPATARGLGVTDPWDPVQNIMGGTRYLSQQMKRFGSLDKALAAYNAGPGNVEKYGGIPPFAETRNYVSKIMGGLGDIGDLNPRPNAGGGNQLRGGITGGVNPGNLTGGAVGSTRLGGLQLGGSGGLDVTNASPYRDFAIDLIFEDMPQVGSMIRDRFKSLETMPERIGGLAGGTGRPGSVALGGAVGGGPQLSAPATADGGGLIQAAAQEVGKTAADAMKYIRAAGGTGYEPWCGDFVQAMFKQRGLTPPPARYVPTLLSWARQNERMTTAPAPGDLVIFDWQRNGEPDHVGFYAGRNRDGSINTIEGNTSLPGGGMGVARKRRTRDQIVGYARSGG